MTYDLSHDECQEVINIMEDWFQAIENGTVSMRFPDPKGLKVSMESAEKLIKYFDKFIDAEIIEHEGHWVSAGENTRGKPIDLPADLYRIQGESRIAFAQEIYTKLEILRSKVSNSS